MQVPSVSQGISSHKTGSNCAAPSAQGAGAAGEPVAVGGGPVGGKVGVLLLTPLLLLLPTTAVFAAAAALLHGGATAVRVRPPPGLPLIFPYKSSFRGTGIPVGC